MATPHPGHEGILEDALRAPSAHNAQAWRLAPLGDARSYEVHYDHNEYLPLDPDDRDAYLAMGAYVETMAMAADRRGMCCAFTPRFTRDGTDLLVGIVTITERGDAPADPLAAHAPRRQTNRAPYRRGVAVPTRLEADLADYGCVLLAPRRVLPLAVEASVRSWADRRFVSDLRTWVRFHDGSPDGMTPEQLHLSRVDRTALRWALRRGRLPWPGGLVYSSRDLRLTMASSALAVLCAEDMTPAGLFIAGRRLLRAWVAATAAGWVCHPLSIVIDRPETAPKLAQLTGRPHPVALFRIGITPELAGRSNRRSLSSVLREPAGLQTASTRHAGPGEADRDGGARDVQLARGAATWGQR